MERSNLEGFAGVRVERDGDRITAIEFVDSRGPVDARKVLAAIAAAQGVHLRLLWKYARHERRDDGVRCEVVPCDIDDKAEGLAIARVVLDCAAPEADEKWCRFCEMGQTEGPQHHLMCPIPRAQRLVQTADARKDGAK